MGRKKKQRTPIELTVDRLELKGSSGVDAQGRRWTVKGASIGASVTAWPGRKGKARLLEILTEPADSVDPTCPVFGVCGGCQLQRMPLAKQREEKHKMVQRAAGDLHGITIHDIRGGAAGYGYRNKLELSFGPRRFLPEDQKDDPDAVREGSFLGFHPRGWFSRIVPLERCPLGSDAMNQVIALVSKAELSPPWDNDNHTGVWRHLVVREGASGTVAILVTSSAADPDEVRSIGARLGALEPVVGVLWVVTDRLSDVAVGDLAEVLYGQPWLDMTVGELALRLPYDGFFQVNTPTTQILFDTIAEALGMPETPTGTLLDLYCGVGAIGLYLASRFERVLGIELNPASIDCARDNAARQQVAGEWHAGKVEDLLPRLAPMDPKWIVVDPPRAGLHPAAARFLAAQSAESLVYVACNPGSLGRDREILEAGRWKMTDLWSVDLFPQTPHTEAVARFVLR
ncbi:MAG: 23S rRNA (uracil(1939)-C(5))-methyltransferase RlmD [Myxococcota bacterium]